MDAVILAAALLALAGWVAAPLYRAALAPADPARGELEARRDALIAHLRELRADHASGLLPDADYDRQRREAEDEAVDVLRRLESRPD